MSNFVRIFTNQIMFPKGCHAIKCVRQNIEMQSNAVKTRSNFSRCYKRHCDNSGRKWIRYQNHNRHPIAGPHGWASYGVSKWWRKLNDRALQRRHDGHDGVSDHQPQDCLLNRLFRRRSKKTSKLCVTGLYAGNSPVTGEFPAQMASNAENVSIRWRIMDPIWGPQTCSS